MSHVAYSHVSFSELTSLVREERADFSAYSELYDFCSVGFHFSLGAWDRLCYFSVAFPMPSIKLFTAKKPEFWFRTKVTLSKKPISLTILMTFYVVLIFNEQSKIVNSFIIQTCDTHGMKRNNISTDNTYKRKHVELYEIWCETF